MSLQPATTPWLRRARWAVAVAAIACLVAGLIWVYRAAMDGDVLRTVSGAAFCLAVIAFDCAAGAVLRLGGHVLRSARRLDSLETRVAGLEVAVDSIVELPDAKAVEQENTAALVAARLDRDVFPRLVQGEEREQLAAAIDAAVRTTSAGQRRLEEQARRELARLRDEFADSVRRGDYAIALRAGERIQTLFPDSELAAQFQAIRRHLLKRLPEAPPDGQASVV